MLERSSLHYVEASLSWQNVPLPVSERLTYPNGKEFICSAAVKDG